MARSAVDSTRSDQPKPDVIARHIDWMRFGSGEELRAYFGHDWAIVFSVFKYEKLHTSLPTLLPKQYEVLLCLGERWKLGTAPPRHMYPESAVKALEHWLPLPDRCPSEVKDTLEKYRDLLLSRNCRCKIVPRCLQREWYISDTYPERGEVAILNDLK